MDKAAQKRNFLNKLHEKVSPGGLAEKLFNPEFQRVMDSLRSVDGDIRSIVAGKSIDKGDPGSDEMSMKNLLKEAKKNFNRREYMTSVAYLGRFHKKLNDIINRIEDLNVDLNQVHEDFLFKDLESEHLDQLRDLRTRFANIVARDSLMIQAGLRDTLHNIMSERGRALAAWEKRYPKQVKKLKRDTQNILNKSDQILNLILSNLKVMGSFRASRKPDPYLKSAQKITESFNKYHSMFQTYYNDNIKGFLDNQQFLDPPSEKPEEGTEESETTETPSIPDISVPPKSQPSSKPQSSIPYDEVPRDSEGVPMVDFDGKPYKFDEMLRGNEPLPSQSPVPSMPSSDTSKTTKPVGKNPSTRDTLVADLPSTMEPPKPPKGMSDMTDDNPFGFTESPKTAHSNFISHLETLSNEDPKLLAIYIKKYANKIQHTDSVSASRLRLLANKIIGS